MTEKPVKNIRVAIVGGGLVGPMCASVFAKRGYHVDIYESRGDIRKAEMVRGRSINMALSVRGRTALKEIGLEKYIIKELSTPMKGRMIHRVDGTKYSILYDEINNECIYSVSRRKLNETLLTAAEKYPNVKIHFNTKMISADLENGVMTFLGTEAEKVFKAEADLIIGADGAHSSVRKEMMKKPLYNYSQQYIEHGYMELCIPTNSEGEFAMEPEYLHIWPRGDFMMIALPNQDKTWTSTLFMPFTQFEELDNKNKVVKFFERYFPDALTLMTEGRLCKDFFSANPFPLISIKCRPYHFQDKAVIIGDAAHAMVPFYGQGMNAGFEDCTVLNRLMMKYSDRLNLVLAEYSKIRNPDAEAICDLSMYNYVEMRDLVNKRSFLLRKKVNNLLHRLFPKKWVPLYHSVTFTNMNYSQCTANEKYQNRILLAAIVIILAEVFLFLYSICIRLST